jgi:chemotaxis protein MotB
MNMANDQTVAPVIIKRKKIIAADGHHGGAWKVAYADFVTAMMAFFMLMWLLNATTEQQKKGIADYFSPTLAINRTSGGGDSSFVGETVLTEETLTRQGVGASTIYPTESAGSRGATGLDSEGSKESKVFQEVVDRLSMQSGESAETDNIMKHIVTRVTDEGLVVEFYDSSENTLFDHSNKPTPLLDALMRATFRAADVVTNPVALEAHVASPPIVLANKPQWRVNRHRRRMTQAPQTQTSLSQHCLLRLRQHRQIKHSSAQQTYQSPNRSFEIYFRSKLRSHNNMKLNCPPENLAT